MVYTAGEESAKRAGNMGVSHRFSHTRDLELSMQVPILTYNRQCRVSVRTGWPGVCKL